MKKHFLSIFIIAMLLFTLTFVLLACNSSSENSQNNTKTTATDGQDIPADEQTDKRKTIYKDNVPAMDLEGYNFRILADPVHFIHAEWDFEEETGDIINDNIYRRNRIIEDRFNILITQISDSSKIRKSVKSGADEYDIVTTWCDAMRAYLCEGLGYMFTDYGLYIDLTQPYWDANVTNALTFGNTVLFPIGAADLPSYDYTHMMLFNKQMVADLALEDPYELVKSGKWTFDKFDEMAKGITRDLDGDGELTKNDMYGYSAVVKYVLPVFYVSAGVESFSRSDKNIPEFSTLLGNEKFASVIDKIFAITYDNNSWYRDTTTLSNSSDVGDAMFMSNRALFFDTTFKLIENLRNMDTEFGIIPYPKYTLQDNYYTYMDGCNPFIVPLTVENPVNVGAVIEAITCESYNMVIPAYYEVSLKTKQARDEESEEMLDLIFSNRVFDLGSTIWCGILRDGVFLRMFQKNDRNLTSQLEKIENKVNKEIQNVLDALNISE